MSTLAKRRVRSVNCCQVVGGAMRAFRALDQLLRAAPTSVLNGQLSPLRRLAWAQRPLQDLLTIKRAYGTTVNDVILAAVAGGIVGAW